MNCDIVRDLLPLYADGLSSDVSNKAIENHIKTCPACRTLTEQMRTPIEPEPVDEATACINALHAQRRKNHRRIIIACAGPSTYSANTVTMLANPSLMPGRGIARDSGI